ncbi:MAG TPA: hypothetical protein VFA03_03415 [Acetobacteraceae bacterium]|nr:hypothetical protein [Acetobacteraceae bacterium]
MRVIVLPITLSPPAREDDAIELARPVKLRLGLDAEPSWIGLSEGNDVIRPGPDLRFVPGQGPQTVAPGFLAPRLFRAVRDRFAARVRAKGSGFVRRISGD